LKSPVSFVGIILIISVLCTLPVSGKVDTDVFKGIKARSIGPANMSGRIAAIDVVLSNTDIIYVGTATGGLWKSLNGGITWNPIFDDQPASSIGAVQVFQANPNIVWVGTGEGNPRNSSGVGRGVFKSLDAGKTWLKLGLDKTEKISRILLHPVNPDIAYAAALGTTWGENPERGVFKTTDGGKTWSKILYVDQKTGVADLVMEPGNPNKLIAAMWEHRRWPYFFNSGGPGSGIHITSDGGENWKRLTDEDGLPKGELGRIGLAFAVNKPTIVYAMVEAEKNVLLRSQDGGFHWKTVNDDPEVNGRPFYYCDIRVNPVNENIVYSLDSEVKVSEDGGRTFTAMANFSQSHSDYHAMWNHPNGDHLLVGNDGGVVITRDRGKSWQFMANLPLAQFYHISFDMETPYNVYGGLQDNGSWRGPSTVLTEGGIFAHHWRMVGFGDGFDTEPDPENSKNGYGMSQGGALFYYNLESGHNRNIRPTESEVKHRYSWNAALALDPFEKGTIYYGSQFVHKSTDRGSSWEIISPDLTSNDPERQKQAQSGGLTLDVTDAENNTTIYSIAPSPVEKGVIWVGTDDGNVQLTRDGGKTWELVSKSITAPAGTVVKQSKKAGKFLVPQGAWVSHVEASKFDASSAFVVYDDHRRANWDTYVFAVSDFGKTWKALSPDQIDGFAHVIEQDHVNKDLLFLGTEFGMYVSFNGGTDWMPWKHGVPTVPIRDMNIHPRDNDLIIGSHGRAAYIIDDIGPLREINADLLKKEMHLFKVQDTFQYRGGWKPAMVSPGDAMFRGANRADGVIVTYLWNPAPKVPEGKKGESKKEEMSEVPELGSSEAGKKDKKPGGLKVEILDKDKKVIRELEIKPEKGINRFDWDMWGKAFERPGATRRGGFGRNRGGLLALSGTYTVRFTQGKNVQEQTFELKDDPRLKMDRAVLETNFQTATEVGGWMAALADIHKRIEETKKVLSTVKGFADSLEKDKKKALLEKADELTKKLKTFSEKIFRDRNLKGIRDNSEKFLSKLYDALGGFSNQYQPATQAAQYKYERVKKELEPVLKEANELFKTDVDAFKKVLESSGFSFFKEFKPVELKK